jgi:hypothetical protein
MGEWMYISHIFLTSALVGGEWTASRPGRFTPELRATGTQWIGDWVGPRVGLDDVEKRKFLTVSGLELGRPARNQSLYRLRYPISKMEIILKRILQNHDVMDWNGFVRFRMQTTGGWFHKILGIS